MDLQGVVDSLIAAAIIAVLAWAWRTIKMYRERIIQLEKESDAYKAESAETIAALEMTVQGLQAEVRDIRGGLSEAVRMAQDPSGVLVEQLAKNYAKLRGTPASDVPRGAAQQEYTNLKAPPITTERG